MSQLSLFGFDDDATPLAVVSRPDDIATAAPAKKTRKPKSVAVTPDVATTAEPKGKRSPAARPAEKATPTKVMPKDVHELLVNGAWYPAKGTFYCGDALFAQIDTRIRPGMMCAMPACTMSDEHYHTFGCDDSSKVR